MDIGDPQRVIRVAQLETPAEEPGPVQDPLEPVEIPEPAPVGGRSSTRVVRSHRVSSAISHTRPT